MLIFPTTVDKIKVETPMNVVWKKSKKKKELLRCLAIAALNQVREQLNTIKPGAHIINFCKYKKIKNISTKHCTSNAKFSSDIAKLSVLLN